MLIHAKVTRLKGLEGLKALVMSPTRELAEQIARVLLLLVQGLRLHCCLLSTAAVVAGTDFSKVFACPFFLTAERRLSAATLSHLHRCMALLQEPCSALLL